jgi:cyclophilin family peptidyl-prolyl cis-trans isomerase
MPRQYNQPPEMAIDASKSYSATIRTNHGDITLDLLPSAAPKTVNNFVFLAREGYYDGVIFHRVIPNFMIQGGDPTGTGMSGPGYQFEDEFDPAFGFDTPGILAMANAGPNTNGSQWFVVHGADVGLPPNYTIFGMLTDGDDVLDALATSPVRTSRGGENSQPTERLAIENIEITETAIG